MYERGTQGRLLSSIRDPNPVVFMESKILCRFAVKQAPIDDYTIPLSCAETLILGSDLTLLIWGTPVYRCESAIQLLNSPPSSLTPLILLSLRSVKIKLIDLQIRSPWDMDAVVESVCRTKRLVIVHEAGMSGGVGSEIAAEISKGAFLRSEALVLATLHFEKFNMPDETKILDGTVETLSY
ncbi:hypothetical protein AZE42_03731 [Rhizopogon vesiculosus]|uniref:Transketolase C-terminal domain-containing protein n=1 Tax=Rhizopogon vesiculosus TaxID=180088 RepID=A0A1J8R092_9AGAM|nr:hypothetical protein AZE42_03731 [Rhizopogon vesiculosus]